jgi:glycosyltransferase involved in cell wall biosynthesis
MKIDLHCHSRFSERPSEWILQKLGCAESYTDPEALYRIAKARGMDRVTITDHNAIDGCLAIAHYPDVFISEEITAYFPEDGCKLHVLAYGISPRQHEDISRLRKNVYELVEFLNAERIVHAVAHPLFAVNGRLTTAHVEKLLVLFENFELNGARNECLNDCFRQVLDRVDPLRFRTLMERQHLEPVFELKVHKRLIGGSDDHSGLTIGTRYTQVEGAHDLAGFWKGVREGLAGVTGRSATPLGFARNLYGIAYQHYREKLKIKPGNTDAVFHVLDRFLVPAERVPQEPSVMEKIGGMLQSLLEKSATSKQGGMIARLRTEVAELVRTRPDIGLILKRKAQDPGVLDRDWFLLFDAVTNKIFLEAGVEQIRSFWKGELFGIFQGLASTGMLYLVFAPYSVAYSLFRRDTSFTEKVMKDFGIPGDPEEKKVRVAHFTDTFYEVNGVAKTLQRQAAVAARLGKNYRIILCDDEGHADQACVKRFKPLGSFRFDEYPGQKLFYPPFLEILNYCYEEKITHIHAATPGPLGLAALAVARILRLPIYGTYHTAFPSYAGELTQDDAMEAAIWKCMTWFYGQMDRVFAPSTYTAQELIRKGLSVDKVVTYPRGVDIDAFNPCYRNGRFEALGDTIKLLYVGRVSKEKNLALLSRVFRKLAAKRRDVSLIITGEGPYLEEMKKDLKGLPCLFTGGAGGEALARIYASCDVLVFPSTTDTFGNVVLEAQASGIPVIVTEHGGPVENMTPGQTGWVARGSDEEGFLAAIEDAVSDRKRLASMGKFAREKMAERSFEKMFAKAWRLYGKSPQTNEGPPPRSGDAPARAPRRGHKKNAQMASSVL